MTHNILWVAMICGGWLATLVCGGWLNDRLQAWRWDRRITRRLRALGAYRRGLAPPLRNASPHEATRRKLQR